MGKKDDNELLYSLYEVNYSDENKHTATVFLHCANGRMFITGETGYCDRGELLLAEWSGDELKALYKASVVGDKVKTAKCIKGWGNISKVPMSVVTDYRSWGGNKPLFFYTKIGTTNYPFKNCPVVK